MTTRNRTSKYICSYKNRLCLFGQVAGRLKKRIEEQTKSCLIKIESLLKEGYSKKSRILTTTIFLQDIKDFNAKEINN